MNMPLPSKLVTQVLAPIDIRNNSDQTPTSKRSTPTSAR